MIDLVERIDDDRVVLDDLEVGELANYFDDADPEDLLAWAFDRFGPRVALVSSFQAEAMALLDMSTRINPNVRVITIDTGRMPQETYDLIERTRRRYDLDIEVLSPDSQAVETMVRRNGVNLFYENVNKRLLCCHVRKVMPLQRALRGLDAWGTGLRREQWATRANIRKLEIDHDHGGIVKINPLADWTQDDVWDYLRANDVPYHALYDQGYLSISCSPCTRPVPEGGDGRAGRWWWESGAPKECGMHCSIETGGFEHEIEALIGNRTH